MSVSPDVPEETSAPELLHREILATINRYQQEADVSICEVLGVLRFVEEDVIRAVFRPR